MSPLGSGAGTALNPVLLTWAGVATLAATLISFGSILLHLKNYRKNVLQRMVIRIMLMIPIYAISSFISLFSLQAAFFIDAIRDIYEAFVIYVFFQLLIAYLGGERSLLILLHGRPPIHPLFPVNLFKRELDASDPYTYLWLKRGILQYVQVKPVLAAVTIILKALGKFDEGDLKAGSGYLYISIIYNISIGVALYCLAMFWVVVNADLRPFRPMPKFLCVKGILFFSFWQSFFISILVAAGVVTRLGPYTDASYISLALTDLLICLEMPIFAIAHMYAFSHTDYMDPDIQYAARMPLRYAVRDAFGLKDVIEDSKATLRGEGMDYRAFEPAEGKIHQGSGRDRRIKAGLRYGQGGRKKYWLPGVSTEASAKRGGGLRGVDRARNHVTDEEGMYSPLLEDQGRGIVHAASDLRLELDADSGWDSDGLSLTYSDPHASEDELYESSRSYLFGDYNYPCIDVSGEAARHAMWEEEERILRDERAAYFSPSLTPHGRLMDGNRKSYGAMGGSHRPATRGGFGLFKGKDVARNHHLSRDEEPLDEDQIRGAAVIDLESDRIPDLGVGDVKLRWSKQARLIPVHQHRISLIAGPSTDHDEGYDSISPSSESPLRSGPPTPSRQPRQGIQSSPKVVESVLPHDAIDLVVEDSQTGVRMAKDRRKGGGLAMHGQSGSSPGLRKVYRRQYELQDEEDEVLGVEVSEELGAIGETGDKNEDRQQKMDVEVAKQGESEPGFLRGPRTAEVTGMNVARAAMSQPHARTNPTKYTPDDKDNPWS